MKLPLYSIIAIALPIVFSLYEIPSFFSQRPTIGILSSPSDFPDKYDPAEYSYIKETYIRYITESGGEPLFIPYDLSDAELYPLLEGVNAVLLPGGGAKYWQDDEKTGKRRLSDFVLKAKRVVDYVANKNKEGIYLPLFGICQGMEVILMALTGDPYLLDTYVDANTHDPLEITKEGQDSRMFKDVPDDDRDFIRDHGTLAFNHNYGYNLSSLDHYPELNNSLILTATANDKNNKTFMACIEAKEWPMYITMFHNEQILWEKELGHKNHSGQVLDFVMRLGRFYVAEAKKDTRKFEKGFYWKRWDFKQYGTTLVEEGEPNIYVAKKTEIMFPKGNLAQFISSLERLMVW